MDIFEVILWILRRSDVAQTSWRNRQSGCERFSPSEAHWSTTKSFMQARPAPHMHQAKKHKSLKLRVICRFAHHEDRLYDVICADHIIEKGDPHDDKQEA
jgi:hypothetical protein